MIWSSRERNRSCSLVSRRSRGRIANLPAPSARARRITACDSRESSKSICKEIALQRPKTGKFDYLSEPNHPAHSIAFKFFTGDESPSPVSTGHSVTNINASLVRERSVHGRWPPLTRKRFEACRLGPLGREIGIASDPPPAVVLAQNRECVARTSNWLATRRRDGHVNVVAQI